MLEERWVARLGFGGGGGGGLGFVVDAEDECGCEGGRFVESGLAVVEGGPFDTDDGFSLGGGGFIERGGALLDVWFVDDGLDLGGGGFIERGAAVVGWVFRFGLWRTCGGGSTSEDVSLFSEARSAFAVEDGFDFSFVT